MIKKRLLGKVLGVVALVGWLFAWCAYLGRALSQPWLVVVTVTAGVLVVIAWRLSVYGRDADDAMTPWREFRFIRNLSFRADDFRSCTLTLELVRKERVSQGIEGDSITLQFTGVRQMSWSQLWNEYLCFEPVCEDFGDRRRDGLRYRISDRYDDTFSFRCKSIEKVSD